MNWQYFRERAKKYSETHSIVIIYVPIIKEWEFWELAYNIVDAKF